MPVSEGDTKVFLTHVNGSSIEVLYYGATILSWKTKDGIERLWMSSRARLDGSKEEIMGGIPLVYPVFGLVDKERTKNVPHHGFANSLTWMYEGIIQDNDEAVSVRLTICDNEDTRMIWPFAFKLDYIITLKADTLEPVLTITNPCNKQDLQYHVLVHTYFKVPDVTKIKVNGFDGVTYRDKTQNGQVLFQNGSLQITKETDNVYMDVKANMLKIETGDASYGNFAVVKEGFNDTVTWNPWRGASEKMTAFGPEDGWKHMVCVEVGNVAEFATLLPGESWTGKAMLSVQ